MRPDSVLFAKKVLCLGHFLFSSQPIFDLRLERQCCGSAVTMNCRFNLKKEVCQNEVSGKTFCSDSLTVLKEQMADTVIEGFLTHYSSEPSVCNPMDFGVGRTARTEVENKLRYLLTPLYRGKTKTRLSVRQQLDVHTHILKNYKLHHFQVQWFPILCTWHF